MKSFLFGAFIEYLSLDRGGARWRTATALLVSNVLFIFGALFFHWSFGVVVFLYWAENLVIGALQVFVAGLIFTERPWGSALGMFGAFLGILVNFLSVGAYPVWSVLLIALDFFVLFTLATNLDD